MRRASTLLWFSCFAIIAVALVEAGRARPAFAEPGASGVGGFTILGAGTGEGGEARPYEIVVVVDNYAEMLFVYSIETANDRRVQLRGGQSLPALFRTARGG